MRAYVTWSLIAVGAIAFAAGCSDRKASAANDGKASPASSDKVDLPGFDQSGFLESERRSFARLVQKYPSACGKAHSLAVSVKTDPGCKRSVFAVKYIYKLIKAHLLESEIEDLFEERYRQGPPVTIDLTDAPMRGTAGAPIAIVEFSDFRCPHCKKARDELRRVLEEFPGQVRVYFKNFPLASVHPESPMLAAAALAAGKQGKFWEFHDRLFDNQSEDAPALVDKAAKELKLDPKKWKADMEAAAQQVLRDRAEGEKLEINSTPTIYFNGRKYSGSHRFEELKDFIDELLHS